MSRELILSMTVSVEGFVAGPNGETDWMFPAMSDEGRQWVAEQMWQAGLLAMGHGSYQSWADFWPRTVAPTAGPMNELPKVVFSRKGAISPPNTEKTTTALNDETKTDSSERKTIERALESWLHPIVTGHDLIADVQRLKAEEGKPILAIGGISFAKSLIATNLVDAFRLSVHPIALGHGIPLFGELETPVRFKLEELKQFASGAVVKTYRPTYIK
jgi:dihydrofolate reductase